MQSNEDIVARFRQKVSESPDNELFRFSLAKALYDLGELDEAETHFKVCRDKRPDWMVVEILLGRIALQKGDNAAARRRLQHALYLAIEQDHHDPEMEIRELIAGLDVV